MWHGIKIKIIIRKYNYLHNFYFVNKLTLIYFFMQIEHIYFNSIDSSKSEGSPSTYIK